MVNARATNNKKRSATTKIQGKPSKNLKKADPVEEVIERDLFCSNTLLMSNIF